MEAILLEHEPDAVIITETWLSTQVEDTDFVPPNYVCFRKDRESRGGGVAVVIKEELESEVMPNLDGIESLFCKIVINKCPIMIGAVYRPPLTNETYFTSINDYLCEHVRSKNSRIVLAGDFNLPNIDWLNMCATHGEVSTSQALINLVFSHDLTQIVQQSTRTQGSVSSLLDLVFLSKRLSQSRYSCEVLDGISDHDMVLVTCPLGKREKVPPETVSFPDFSKADDESICDFFNLHYDSFRQFSALNATSVDEIWARFKTMVHTAINNFIPLRVKKISKQNPWITKNIIRMKRRLKRKRRNLKKCETPQKREEVQGLSDTFKSEVRNAKCFYMENSLTNFLKNSPEKFWRHLSPVKETVPGIVKNGSIITDKWQVASSFNHYFQSVFTRDDGILPNFYVPCGIPAITDVTVNQQGLFNLLLNLDAKKSSGPDEIPNIFLKRYAEWCSHYLVIIFNLTLDKGTIPRDWKCGKIIPVHKKGDKTILSNYRPISLTSTCCKTLEHILSKHLITFIESNKLLGSNQYGFRRGCSTTTQLIEIFHDLSITADKGGQTDIIFLDFAKAFDRVSHPKLLYKLSHVLKNDQIVDWLNSYLSGREQYVYFKKERTESLQVISGVPQGSVLGPLLFILFISDMGKDFDSAVTLKHFADDTVIYSNISSNEDQLNLDKHLRKIMKWCADWQMELNISKTVYMNVTRKKQHLQFNYSINGLPLVKVNEYKYLGVHLRSDLSWNSHIDYVCKKAFQKLWMLKTKLEFASSDVKLIAFKCLILPTLEYASPVWEPFTNQNIYKLERIQNKAARFIFNCYRSTESVTKLKEQAGLPSIKTRLETNRMKLFFQIFHGHSMLDTRKYVVMSPPVYHRIKHSLNIQSYQYSTDHFKHSFFVRCIDFWNKLPECIVNSQSVSTFVKEIEMFLSSHVTKGCD